MVCTTCGQNHSQSAPLFNIGGTSSCKKTIQCNTPNLNWLIPVTGLPDISAANRTHAYVNEAGQVFILNYDGDGWLMIEGGDATQVQSDWNVTDITDPAYIKNKPDIALKSDLDPLLAKDVDLQNQINNIRDVIDEIHNKDQQQDDRLNGHDTAINNLKSMDTTQNGRLDALETADEEQIERITSLENTNFTPTNWVYNSQFIPKATAANQASGWYSENNAWYTTKANLSGVDGNFGLGIRSTGAIEVTSKMISTGNLNQNTWVLRAAIRNYIDKPGSIARIGFRFYNAQKAFVEEYSIDTTSVPVDDKLHVVGQEFDVSTTQKWFVEFFAVSGASSHSMLVQPALYVRTTEHPDSDYYKYFPDTFGLSELTDWDDIQNKPAIPDDTNLVHKTGDETINGTKTFSQPIVTADSDDIVDVIKAPTTPIIKYAKYQALGAGLLIGSNGLSILSGGEGGLVYLTSVKNQEPFDSPNLTPVPNLGWEYSVMVADSDSIIVSNYDSGGADAHEFKFSHDGKLYLDQQQIDVSSILLPKVASTSGTQSDDGSQTTEGATSAVETYTEFDKLKARVDELEQLVAKLTKERE